MSLFSKLVVGATHARPVEKMITKTRPGKALARRFVAGDTLDEAVEAARVINDDGMKVSLDLLGEDVYNTESAKRARDEYAESLHRIAEEGLDSNISIKLTQLGLSINERLAAESLAGLARRAAEIGISVTVDMEDSRYTEATVRLYARARNDHDNLGIALQSYLHRTPRDLKQLAPLGGHIRLCKGAYVESAEIALTRKSDVDEAFARQLRRLMADNGVKPAVATHDLVLIDLARELVPAREAYFEFQMLYGVRAPLQKELVAEGYPVRVYLPFGSQWYPYLTRRLAERPSNAWFFVKAALGS